MPNLRAAAFRKSGTEIGVEKLATLATTAATTLAGLSATEAEFIAHCSTLMAGFKAPKRMIFTDLPKTSTGKIQNYVLRSSIRGYASASGD